MNESEEEVESLDPAPMRVIVAGLEDLDNELVPVVLLRLEFLFREPTELIFMLEGATTSDSRE